MDIFLCDAFPYDIFRLLLDILYLKYMKECQICMYEYNLHTYTFSSILPVLPDELLIERNYSRR